MKIKVIKKLGKETTIRSVYKDDSTRIGIMGKVDDLMNLNVFSSCSAPRDYWSLISDINYVGKAIFAESREELLRLMNHKL